MNRRTILFNQFIVSLIPLAFLAGVWRRLPQRVPLHYSLDMKVNSYGGKEGILMLVVMLVLLTIMTSMLVMYAPQSKFPRRPEMPVKKRIRLSWIFVVLLTAVSVGVVALTWKMAA